jgi:hypothetical protein
VLHFASELRPSKLWLWVNPEQRGIAGFTGDQPSARRFMFQKSKIELMLRNPKSPYVTMMSSVYVLFTSLKPALSADIYCSDGAGTVSITINGTIFPVPTEWPIQSVTLDTGASGTSANYFKIFIIQRLTKSIVPDRHTAFLIGVAIIPCNLAVYT